MAFATPTKLVLFCETDKTSIYTRKHTQLIELTAIFMLHPGRGCDLTSKAFPLLTSLLPTFPLGGKHYLSKELSFHISLAFLH